MEVLGVELVALGINFDNCGTLCAPVPVLIVSLGIGVELVQEGVDTTLKLDNQEYRLEVLSED